MTASTGTDRLDEWTANTNGTEPDCARIKYRRNWLGGEVMKTDEG